MMSEMKLRVESSGAINIDAGAPELAVHGSSDSEVA